MATTPPPQPQPNNTPKPQRKSHYDTPTRSKLLGAVEFCEQEDIELNFDTPLKEKASKHFHLSRTQGYDILRTGQPRMQHHSVDNETRGRPLKLTSEQVREADSILKETALEIEGKAYTWQQVATEVGADVSGDTMKRTLESALNYHKCLACLKGWLDDQMMEKRVEYAEIMLRRYPLATQWKHIRFSDEVHFGYGPEGQLRIIRKPGTRYRRDCIQHRDQPKQKDEHRIYAWAAVGWNFKSDLYFYKVPSNSNGKMSMDVYIKDILEGPVKEWLDRGDVFILEEDGDSGHGHASTTNRVRKWKDDKGLETLKNAGHSPDLAPIENCWQPPKQYVRKFPHWDENSLMELAGEGWSKVTQDFINKQILSMPQRLQDVIDSGGKMTGW